MTSSKPCREEAVVLKLDLLSHDISTIILTFILKPQQAMDVIKASGMAHLHVLSQVDCLYYHSHCQPNPVTMSHLDYENSFLLLHMPLPPKSLFSIQICHSSQQTNPEGSIRRKEMAGTVLCEEVQDKITVKYHYITAMGLLHREKSVPNISSIGATETHC